MSTEVTRAHPTIRRSARRRGAVVELTGAIDEHFDLGALSRELGGVIVFDMNEVHRITSYGVREWVRTLDAINAEAYGFVGCRPNIVAQFNMVSRFGGRGRVVSFYLPYLCTQCDRYTERLLDLRTEFSTIAEGKAPVATCEVCQGALELDDVAESYLAHVVAAGQPVLSPALGALVDQHASRVFRVEKEVWHDLTALWLSGPLEERASFRRVVDGSERDVLAVLDDVTSASESGIARLGDLADTLATPLWVARVPERALPLLLGQPLLANRAKLLSVLVRTHCTTCKSPFDAELAIPRGRPVVRCPSCGALGESPSLVDFPLVEANDDVAWYLARFPHASNAMPRSTQRSSQPALDEHPPIGRYSPLRRIGGDGPTEVFLARQVGPQGFERKVALKRVLPAYAQDPDFLKTFLHEAKLAARLSHPNVVRVLELGEVDGEYFIALEYVDGPDLATVLHVARTHGRQVPLEIACRIVADIASALTAAHDHRDDDGEAQPIVHRDVAPQNVLLSSSGVVKLTDFGIARAVSSTTLTESSEVHGKIAYQPPERILQEGSPVDPRSDVFSAGIVLFECLAGEHPFAGPNEAATVRAITICNAPRVSSRRSDAAPLDAIVARALHPVVHERFDAQALRRALDEWLASRDTAVTAIDVARWMKDVLALKDRPPSFPPKTA